MLNFWIFYVLNYQEAVEVIEAIVVAVKAVENAARVEKVVAVLLVMVKDKNLKNMKKAINIQIKKKLCGKIKENIIFHLSNVYIINLHKLIHLILINTPILMIITKKSPGEGMFHNINIYFKVFFAKILYKTKLH